MICATSSLLEFIFQFQMVEKFNEKNGFDFHKNLEEFRNFFRKIAKSCSHVFYIDL